MDTTLSYKSPTLIIFRHENVRLEIFNQKQERKMLH